MNLKRMTSSYFLWSLDEKEVESDANAGIVEPDCEPPAKTSNE